MGATALVVVAAGAAVIGAGVSAYGQYQSGQTQKAIGEFNAQTQEKNAQMKLMSMEAQAALQDQTARANFELRSAEASARVSNAKAIEQQAIGQDAINRENLVKRRDQFERMQGSQRAAIAASGIVESSGTPLDLLAETAGKIQQDQEEQHYAGELQRRTLFSEAAQERLGGRLALAGATLDRNSQISAAALNDAAAKAGYLGAMRGAEISRLTGSAAATAGEFQAAGTLFSGLSSAAGTGMRYSLS